MQTDVKGATCPKNVATTIYNGRTRVKGLLISATAAADTVSVSDNSTVLFTYTAPAAGTFNVLIPGEGVLCKSSAVVTCSTNPSAVAFYG